MKLADVMKNCETTEYAVFDRDLGLACIFDRKQCVDHNETVIRRLYRVLDDDEVVELDVEKMITDVTDALIHALDTRALMRKVLSELPPNDLIKTHEIVTKHPEVAKKAKAMPGCLYIDLENPVPGEQNIAIYVRN